MAQGLVEPGNINLYDRPRVQNPDGSISTVRSISFSDGQHEILIPTVHWDGYVMSDEDAIKHYYQTGQHLGKFADVKSANAYAAKLHNDYAAGLYDPPKLTGLLGKPAKIGSPKR